MRRENQPSNRKERETMENSGKKSGNPQNGTKTKIDNRREIRKLEVKLRKPTV